MKKGKGLALIAVIVMIVLFSSLILAVVLSATISIRRANYYKDKLIALEIAEQGIQEILYRMNYYGYRENDGGTEWKRASWIGYNLQSSTVNIPKWYNDLISSKGFSSSDLNKYETDILFPELGKNAKSTIYFIDINSTTNPETDLDLIISKGSYNGRISTISFLLRGAGEIKNYSSDFWYGDFSDKNTKRTKGNPGIAEAFNKHVIYATTISGTSTQVKGNITTTTPKPNSFPWTDATWTETSNVSLPELMDINSVSLPDRPTTFDENYDSSGNCNGSSTLPAGVTFSGGTYTFESPYSGSNSVKIDGANAILKGGITINNYFYVTGGNITIDATSNPITFGNGSCVELETGEMGINNDSRINGDLRIKCQTNSDLNSAFTLSGSLIWEGGELSISGTSNKVISGSLIVKGNNLTLNGNITINASSCNKEAGIIVFDGNLTISSSPSITIGDNQLASILVYSNSGNRNVNISSSPTFSFPSNRINQLAIIGYSTGGSININITGNIPRGIYSKGNNNNGNITLNSGSTINGCLIANGTVNLNGGILTYDAEPFKKNSEVYKGFVGGRRKYLPVPGSWRIEW